MDWDKHHSLFAGVSYKSFSLQAYSSSRKKGIPTGAWGIDFNDPNAEFYDAQGFVEGRFEHEFSARLQMTVRAHYYDYDYSGIFMYSGEPSGDESSDHSLGGEVRFLWDTASRNRVVFGLEYRNHLKASYRYGGTDYDIFKGDFPEQVYSFYAQDEFTLTNTITLTAGFLDDYYSTIGNTLVPRASLIYRPFPGSTLKLLYGEAFRAPNIYERYYIDNEETGYVNQKVNPDLGEEKVKTLELAWEQRLAGGLFGTLSLYSFRLDDLIDLGIDPADDFYWYENAGTAKSRGLELGRPWTPPATGRGPPWTPARRTPRAARWRPARSRCDDLSSCPPRSGAALTRRCGTGGRIDNAARDRGVVRRYRRVDWTIPVGFSSAPIRSFEEAPILENDGAFG